MGSTGMACRGAVEFRILGPLEIRVHDTSVPLAGQREQRAVAMLLLAADRVVGLSQLIDAVWEEHPPPTAKRQIQNRLSVVRRRLRQARAPSDILLFDGYGYRLDLAHAQLDARLFEELSAAARGESDRIQAVRSLRSALGLWRGPALAGIGGLAIQAGAARLDELRLTAIEECLDHELALGCHAAVVSELAGLAMEHPTRERIVGQLMLALHRSGRQAEALQAYHDLRGRLADEMGVDPGPQLYELHAAILRNNPGVMNPVDGRVRSGPRQLPAAVPHFAGRSTELAALTELLTGPTEAGGTVVISAIGGTAGVGKSALAVHWAHLVRDRFPDGQLCVDLRGFHAAGSVVTPAEALRGFLDALDVPPQRIPAGPDAQGALFRSLLDGRRMLILLDNARDSGQVRPLLPGTPGCLVLVTSRNLLTGLVAADAARPLLLDLLSHEEARALLIGRLGTDRVSAEPDAVDDIITSCARLPLALVVVAAHAATRPHFTLGDIAAELRGHRRLDVLRGDDPATDVRAVFSWSYHRLTPDAARLFRLLGLHAGPDISAAATASLAGLPIAEVWPLLGELTAARLVVEHVPGRYALHDLLREYAAESTRTTDDAGERAAATRRMLDHYLHTAYAADHVLNPTRDPITLGAPSPGVSPETPPDRETASTWFANEHPVLMAAIDHAAASNWDVHTWQLSWTVSTYLDQRGHWHDHARIGSAAVAAAERLDDPAARTTAHRDVARAYTQLGQLDEAETHLERALDLSTRSGVGLAQAHTLYSLAALRDRQGRHGEALTDAQRALALFRATGHRAGQAVTLNTVSWLHSVLGDLPQAISYGEQALTVFRELDNRQGLASTWDSLGYAHHHLGQHATAATYYQHALDLYREIGDRYYEADTLNHLAETQLAAGDREAARAIYRQALGILDDLRHPDAEPTRSKLQALSDP